MYRCLEEVDYLHANKTLHDDNKNKLEKKNVMNHPNNYSTRQISVAMRPLGT